MTKRRMLIAALTAGLLAVLPACKQENRGTGGSGQESQEQPSGIGGTGQEQPSGTSGAGSQGQEEQLPSGSGGTGSEATPDAGSK